MIIFLILFIIGCKSNIDFNNIKIKSNLEDIKSIELEEEVLDKLDRLYFSERIEHNTVSEILGKVEYMSLLNNFFERKFFRTIDLILFKNPKMNIDILLKHYEMFDNNLNLNIDDEQTDYLVSRSFNISKILFNAIEIYCKLINSLIVDKSKIKKGDLEELKFKMDELDNKLKIVIRYLLIKGADKNYIDESGNNLLSNIVLIDPFLKYKIHEKERVYLEERHFLLFKEIEEIVEDITFSGFDYKFTNEKTEKDLLQISINSKNLFEFILKKSNIFLYKMGSSLSSNHLPLIDTEIKKIFFNNLTKKYKSLKKDYNANQKNINIFLAPNRLLFKTKINNSCRESYCNLKRSILMLIGEVYKLKKDDNSFNDLSHLFIRIAEHKNITYEISQYL